MKILTLIFTLSLMIITNSVYATTTFTTGVTITKIDAVTYDGDIKIRTSPKPTDDVLNCSTTYWVILRSDSGNYDAMFSMLLSAKVNGLNVSVGVDDTNLTGGFCELSRIIID